MKAWKKGLYTCLIVLLFLILFCTNIVFADGIIRDDIPQSTIATEKIGNYSAESEIKLNNNNPDFTRYQLRTETFVYFSPLDKLGRTGTGYACLAKETLPTSSRGIIGNIQPSGWHTVRYDDLIEDRYLYNRSHVIGYLLSGDNATPENLFTGTRFLNATSMMRYEISVAQYIEKTGNHVLYRVTPRYRDNDLVAFGVQMEAYSIEDNGKGICFNVFLYNIQPGIIIDYRTGDSKREEKDRNISFDTDIEAEKNDVTYVFNNNSKKFHYPSCPSVTEMKPKNREYFYGTRDEALALGYQPCGSCKP